MERDSLHLVERMLRGESGSFRDVMDWYAQDVLRLGYLLLWDRDEANDVLQETMMRLVERVKSGHFRDGNGSVKAYLLTCTRNLCIDRLRRRKGFLRSMEDAPEHEWIIDDARSPSQTVEHGRFEEAFNHALEQLSDCQRAALVLFDVQGDSHEEIARQLGISVNQSKTELHRARRKMRILLKDFEELT